MKTADQIIKEASAILKDNFPSDYGKMTGLHFFDFCFRAVTFVEELKYRKEVAKLQTKSNTKDG